MKMTNWHFYAAGAGAGALTGILDFAKDTKNGTIARLGGAMKELSPAIDTFFSRHIGAIILILTISLFVCWIYEVTSRLDGFLRGCSVLAAFSIGTPNPIIERQPDPSPQATAPAPPSASSYLPFILSPALAQDVTDSPVEQIYVVLNHLMKASAPLPESIVTVEASDSATRVSLFTIASFLFSINQAQGEYIVEVETPGYETISFAVTVPTPDAAVAVTAERSNLPGFLKGLSNSRQTTAAAPDAEGFKQVGRAQLLHGNYEGAIASYGKSLSIRPDDPQTMNFLGYALYRAGNFVPAKEVLEKAIRTRPSYRTARINLAKVSCADGDLEKARQVLRDGALKISQEPLKSDTEFNRVCASI